MSNHAIFLNGIPAAGKSTVARIVRNQTSSFYVLTGDEIVRQVPYEKRIDVAHLIWARLLDTVEDCLQGNNVLVDSALRADQVIQARDRFGEAAVFVILRIDEKTRARRQAQRDRRGNPLGHPWRPEFHSMPGEDDLYDLVLDAGSLTAELCAHEVVQFAVDRWPDLDP